MRSIAHIINLGIFPETSDLHYAQPVTVETMRIARDFAIGIVNVNLLSAQFPEDRKVVPSHFIATRDLERSVLDVGNFKVKRKLPIVKDILDRAYEMLESDYIIFTNVDIALLPNFYVSVNTLIDLGFDSFVINRRTISKMYTRVEDIPLMFAEVGQSHMGYDCFVFQRDVYQNFVLGLICVGASYIGKALVVNQVATSKRFDIFHDKHLTFHIGDDKTWTSSAVKDYESHNRGEFNRIITDINLDQRTLALKLLSNNRWRGLKNKMGYFLGIG